MGFKIETSLDMSGLDKIWEDMQVLEATTIEWGYPDDVPHKDSDLNIPSIAFLNDQGVKGSDGQWRIPPRPFLSVFANIEAQQEMDRLAVRMMSELGNGKKGLDKGFEYAGKELADLVREAIETGTYVPLSKSTIKQKGHDTVLIETSDLYNSATYKVLRR